MKNNKRGFTLIELLVVIAIIGLLSTLAVVALNNARTKSRDARRVSDIRQVQSALELYFNDNNSYPASVTGTHPGGDCLSTAGFGSCSGTTYMTKVPANPEPGGS
ncbi:MAG: prepilin-type N-terminal cleavage/methylation domain-containing protein, partial [Candidatus Falkowbacteria bacterium]|nr:prepilin-type N-terminal cleavage/methylation domain-containing protein [Candidatus Falkowbacteria bacterium]